MKKAIMYVLLFLVLLSGCVAWPSKSGCPEPVDIKPCKCYNSPTTFLNCENIRDAEVLRKVFMQSYRYSFKEASISYSVLQFLPHEMFGKVSIGKLYLKNVTLSQLFDVPPEELEALDTLQLEATKLNRGLVWNVLKPLSHLRVLTIYYNNVRKLGKEFSDNTAKSLEHISFHETGTKSIESGVFQNFDKLDHVAFSNCKLTEIRRDIFATPFNGRYLHFNKNQLTSIPDDMFTQMPYLSTLNLRDNYLAVLPESAFVGSFAEIQFLMLERNPIHCDCRFSWIIKNKPPALSGKCRAPENLQEKELKDLNMSDFDVYHNTASDNCN